MSNQFIDFKLFLKYLLHSNNFFIVHLFKQVRPHQIIFHISIFYIFNNLKIINYNLQSNME
jgi:hypothetical protein